MMNKGLDNEYLKNERLMREQALKGKWVITQKSRYNQNQVMYLQDTELAKKQGHENMYWTLYLANAKGFDTEYIANAVAKKFKYNHISVICVE